MSILAKAAVIAARDRGDVLIEPFHDRNLKNSSYDVTLGPWYWLETQPESVGEVCVIPTERDTFGADYGVILNPYDEASVKRMWGEVPLRAMQLTKAMPGIPAGSYVIALHPGQNALCSTEQFIGSTGTSITTMMKARSSIGRSQVTVCRCAGAGDIGFANRWTMEITNNGNRTVVLVCGRRIAQILFLDTTQLSDKKDAYSHAGKYQRGTTKGKTLVELEAQWRPEDMLPKMWLDDEVTSGDVLGRMDHSFPADQVGDYDGDEGG